MNQTPEPPDPVGNDAVEARIVAWVLGESSARESADLERLCADRPELSAFRRRIGGLHQSLIQVESSAADTTWKLPPEKRRVLDGIFAEKVVARIDDEKVVPSRRPMFRAILAIAACLLFTAVMLRNLMPITEKDTANNDTKIVSSSAIRSDEIYGVGSLARSKNRDSGLQEMTRQRQLATKKPADAPGEIVAPRPNVAPDLAALTDPFSSAPLVLQAPSGALSGLGMDLSAAVPASPAIISDPRDAEDEIANGNRSIDPTFKDKNVSRNFEGRSRRTSTTATDLLAADRVGAMAPAGPVEHPDRKSTFPFNSGDASFQLAKAALAQGARPDPATIQLEQFYNAVDYGDHAPATGEPVAATIGQSAHPFLPDNHLVRVALQVRSNGQPLAGAFRPAAENIQVQVKFNPQRVRKYQLLGFEQDGTHTAQPTEDPSGVAIYQIEPLPAGSGEIGEVSVRFRDAVSKEMTERTWQISYLSQPTAFDQAAPSMQLAGLSLLAAEKLKGGPLADAIDFKQLTGSSAFVKQFYGSSPRVADMLRVIDALK